MLNVTLSEDDATNRTEFFKILSKVTEQFKDLLPKAELSHEDGMKSFSLLQPLDCLRTTLLPDQVPPFYLKLMKDPVFKGLIQLCSGTSRYRGRTRPNYSDCRETSKFVNAPMSKKRRSSNDTNPVSPVRVRRLGRDYFEPRLDELPLSEMRRR
jgi:hypothetical protein